MNFQSLLDPEIQKFIRNHEDEDVAKLALKPMPDSNWDRSAIMNQIKARQKARVKVPQWLEQENTLLFPNANLVEQASSAATALYKTSIINGEAFIDLTGGMGVDSWALCQSFKKGICVERDKQAADLLAHNLPQICNTPIDVLNSKAEDFITDMPNVDLVFIDPQRRDSGSKGKFRFEDCSPDILKLLPALSSKTQKIIIKASPMLDIHHGIEQLGSVSEVHIIEKDQNCKELLFVLTPEKLNNDPKIVSVAIGPDGNIINRFECTLQAERESSCDFAMPQKYLYEPGAAFIKSGGLKTLAARYEVSKLHPHTHLYTSHGLKSDFPGRIFEIQGVHKAQANDIPDKKANLTIRNFPMTVDKLRKKLKLSDGGSVFYFACTLMNEDKAIISCVKR